MTDETEEPEAPEVEAPGDDEYPQGAPIAEQRRYWAYQDRDRPGVDLPKILAEAATLAEFWASGTVPAAEAPPRRGHLKEVKP